MSMLTEIAARLVSEGVCTAVGKDLFIMHRPATPDLCTMLYQYAGSPPERTHSGPGDDHPSLQVRTRAPSGAFAAGEARAKAVQDAIQDICNETLTSTTWKQCVPQGSPESIGVDEGHRPEWTQNFAIIKDPS